MKIAQVLKNRLFDALWHFFISLKLTFVLLVILGIGAFLGMSYDQTLNFEEFLAKAQDKELFSLFTFFELNDAFHSWWWSLAILLLSANLIACSIERLPRLYFEAVRPRPYLTDRRLLGLSLKKQRYVAHLSEAEELVRKFMPKTISIARTIEGIRYFYKERMLLGRFGVYIVHIALLIVMYSSIYTTQYGVDAHVLVEEGKKTRFINAKGSGGVPYTHDLGFYIGCDDFRLRTFVDNSPMEFESDLFISTEKNEKVLKKTVRVNEPLSYAGFTFYQSSFRPIISERAVTLLINIDGQKTSHNVHLNSEIVLPTKDILIPDKLYDDFAGLGQALRIVKKSPDHKATFFHIFRQHPDFDRTVRADNFDVTLLESDQRYATGLSIGYVPGISIIFSGFLLLLCGLFMCFFMTPTRYFARITKEQEGYLVVVAAQGFRHPHQVRDQFEKKTRAFNALTLESNYE
ncbi:MAG TPA: cytochrome c biogenesis protein ResB [Myxococcota bacterium]|nr:cytochrome c biogenesis protein ResB [Myxococcota bacterium]